MKVLVVGVMMCCGDGCAVGFGEMAHDCVWVIWSISMFGSNEVAVFFGSSEVSVFRFGLYGTSVCFGSYSTSA